MSVAPITCHILDTTRGKPASNVVVQLYHLSSTPTNYDTTSSTARHFASARTDADGRIKNWVYDPAEGLGHLGISGQNWDELRPGIYKAKFLTGKYFLGLAGDDTARRTFFPFVEIVFVVEDPPDKHYHIPLLLSNHSYTTYRGS
ncbi:putative 5-hydroxyisourate hydrolase [Candida viswanathii]|uniref:5-hydroxyisourate hydrolase n=1 Tax=Candida viswanathii TaxID=5486 RepID=A0A367YLJ2_9ASCO|nr:putative 5-hydroxyisourate hydrolase [Candida viswanathii]